MSSKNNEKGLQSANAAAVYTLFRFRPSGPNALFIDYFQKDGKSQLILSGEVHSNKTFLVPKRRTATMRSL